MSECYFDSKGCIADFYCKHKDEIGKCTAKDEDLYDGDWGAYFPKLEDTK